MKKFEKIYPANLGANMTLKLMAGRLGNLDVPPKYYPDTVDNANLMASELVQRGGLPQQERMVRDKRKSLDKATLYSYQAARIKKVQGKDLSNKGLEGEAIVRALILIKISLIMTIKLFLLDLSTDSKLAMYLNGSELILIG